MVGHESPIAALASTLWRIQHGSLWCYGASGDLFVPATSTKTIGPRGFFHAGPTAWNCLPNSMKDTNITFSVFKKLLKTDLFQHWTYSRMRLCGSLLERRRCNTSLIIIMLMSGRSIVFEISVSWSTATWLFRITSTTWLAPASIIYASYVHIIRRSLTTDTTHSLVRALIHTRIDYCNELLAAGPKYLHEKLQSVVRAAARLVLQLPHRASVSGIMRGQLHWLEMPDRVRFKLCTLEYRCLHGLAPHYLSDLCTLVTVHAHLRSSVTLERSLSIPRTKPKMIGSRRFYVLRFVCRLEHTPSASARPWTLAEQLQNWIENSFFSYPTWATFI